MLWCSWLFFCRVAVRSAAGLAVRLGRPPGGIRLGRPLGGRPPAVGRLGRLSGRRDVRTHPDDVLWTWFSRKTSDVTTLIATIFLDIRILVPPDQESLAAEEFASFHKVVPCRNSSWDALLLYSWRENLSSYKSRMLGLGVDFASFSDTSMFSA
jgi:hypothetical protein